MMVPVTEILRNVVGSCDFKWVEQYPGEDEDERRTNFWIDVITTKAADSGFIHLVESMLEHGFVDESAIGWYYREDGGYISEGHHRLVAAILLGMDEVPVTQWGADWYEDRRGMRYRKVDAHDSSTDNAEPAPLHLAF